MPLLLKDFPYSEEFLTNPDNWIPWDVEKALENRLIDLFQDGGIMFKIGQSTIQYKSLGLVHVLGRLFGSPGKLIKSTPRLTKYFTKGLVDVEILDLSRNRAVVEMKVHGRQTRSACLYNQGIYSRIPGLFGYGNVVLTERQCVVPANEINTSWGGTIPKGVHFGAESCIFELKWGNKKESLIEAGLDKKITLADAIKHLEDNYAKLQTAYGEMEKSERKYKSLMENASDIIFLLDLDCVIYSVNRKGLQSLGYRQEEILGRHIGDLLVQESDMASKREGKCLENCPVPFEAVLKPRNSDYLLISATCSHIMNGSEMTGTMLICRDITKEREMNTRLLETEKFAAKGLLAAEIAHEINNSLANIETSLFIADKLHVDGNIKSNALNDVSGEIEELSGIVNSILDVYRSNDQGVQAVDINDEIKKILKMLGRKFSGKGITISANFSPELPKVLCHAGHIKEILLNVIKNAQEALEKSAIKNIIITSSYEDGNVEMIIEDSGPGISDELRGKIFSPLHTTKRHGTGLGLNICRKLIGQYGGSMEIASGPSKGTRVLLKIPVKTNA